MSEKSEAMPVVQLSAKVGESFTIELVGRGTAGYQWQPREPFSPIEFQGRTYEPGKGIGGFGKEKLTFVCLKPGAYELYLDAKRPWEQNKEPLESVHHQILVA